MRAFTFFIVLFFLFNPLTMGIGYGQKFQFSIGPAFSGATIRGNSISTSDLDRITLNPGGYADGAIQTLKFGIFSMLNGVSIGTFGFRDHYVFNGSVQEEEVIERFNLFYANVFVNFQLSPKINNNHLHFLWGPYLGYGLIEYHSIKHRTTSGHDIDFSGTWREFPGPENLKKLDFGLSGGFGVSFSSKLYMKLSYFHGLTSISANQTGGFYWANKSIRVGLGLSIPPKK